MFSLRCAGCGEKWRISFATWWYRLIHDLAGEPAWLHDKCFQDFLDQRKLDGLDDWY